MGARLGLIDPYPPGPLSPLAEKGGADSSPSLLAGRDLGWGKPSNSPWWTSANVH